MDLQHLRASDGTGEAVLAHIQSVRNPGSTVLDLDNVDNWNSKVVVVTGTPAANGYIAAAGMKVMYGHISAGDFIIDGFAPGYADNGNLTTEVAIVKMTTNWADALVDILSVALQDDGKLKVTALDDFYRPSELVFDHIASGCVLTGTGYGSTLAWSLTAGVVYINGRRYTVAAATGVVAATKDTYFDILMPASGTVATLVYTGGNSVANNAASPALAANSIRLGIIVSGASIASVAAINQGQEDKVLPIASSMPYAVTDSLGNLICPRDPNRKLLGYRQLVTSYASTPNTTSEYDLVGLALPVIVPNGRKVVIKGNIQYQQTGGIGTICAALRIKEGATQLQSANIVPAAANLIHPGLVESEITPSAGSHTYKLALLNSAVGPSHTVNAAANAPIYIKVELA